jgi:hypothetical protein
MASIGIPQIDSTAYLNSFLLRSYISSFRDGRLTFEERLRSRMELEALLLGLGPESLKELQRAFDVSPADLMKSAELAEWFLDFARSRDKAWLERVDQRIPERLWRTLHDKGVRRGAAELILTVESSSDIALSTAYGSLIIDLFRSAQPDPFSGQLSPESQVIFDVLVTRLKLTPTSVFRSNEGKLASYSQAVLRYCFRDRHVPFSDSDVAYVSQLAGDLPSDVRERFFNLQAYK